MNTRNKNTNKTMHIINMNCNKLYPMDWITLLSGYQHRPSKKKAHAPTLITRYDSGVIFPATLNDK